MRAGDLVSLRIGPRDGNHGCDLTEVDLDSHGPATSHRWHLAPDVSGDIQAGNPHADRLGNKEVWHFYTEAADDSSGRPVVPPGSMLARWLEASQGADKTRLAAEIQRLPTSKPPTAGKDKESPDAILIRQANSLDGPLLGPIGAAALADRRASRRRRRAMPAHQRTGDSIRGCSASGRTGSRSTRGASASTPPECWRSACPPTWSRVANSS